MNPLHNITPEEGQHYFIDPVPHHRALGMRYVDSGIGRVVFEVPWAPHLVGDPDTGIVHGGVLTASFDAALGGSVISKMPTLCRIVTLDLRIDYLRPAKTRQTIRIEAECNRLAKQVAFARGIAHDGDAGDLIATATGTFMLFVDDSGSHVPSGIVSAALAGRRAK